MGAIKGAVDRLIKKHKTNNPFEIIESKGIILQYADLGDTLGFYFHDSRIKFININNQIDESLQRFVCAHELGHAVLHPKANTPFLKKHTFFSTEKIEVEANTFAVELLLQDEFLYEYKDTSLSIHEISEIYGVPKELSHLKNF